jgi:hypothetical protein
MRTLKEDFLLAKKGDGVAMEALLIRFRLLMHKKAWRTGKYDPDCYQECALAMCVAVTKFEIRK